MTRKILDAVSVQLVESDRERILAEINDEYRQTFVSAVGGFGLHIDIREISGGAKINVIMNKTYGQDVDSVCNDETQIRRDITAAIQNYNGVYLGIFPPDAAFRHCVLQQIELFRRPSLACVDSVALEIANTVKHCVNSLETYPTINEIYAKLSLDYIQKCRKKCKKYVEHFILTERAYLNTNHEDFVKMDSTDTLLVKTTISSSGSSSTPTAAVIPQIIDRPIAASRVGAGAGSLNTSTRKTASTCYDESFTLLPEESDLLTPSIIIGTNMSHVDQINIFVESYISILKKKFKDHIPKLCTLELIDSVKKFIAVKLGIEIRDRIQSIGDIVGDNTDADDQLRQELEKRQQHYREAIDILSRYRDNWCPTSSMASLSID
ncbi:dynamin-3-like [Oppia nitens]|uniref:dynamin-3-like n=1 Tax=Oppia nitens TaxID=1686743 RepID=UPI0023DA5213|nr:dynamin-3-like [Oppia nitens]